HLGCSYKSNAVLPTRVIDVGDRNSDFLRLYCSEKREKAEYIAFSHCWGGLEKEETEKFCTIRGNIGMRRQEFSIDVLPQIFKDAVTITRALGKRYLWIDSLCIIQDDKNDWDIESKKMEDVSSNAYCTIAASSAANPKVGFLGRQPRKYVKVPKSLKDRSEPAKITFSRLSLQDTYG
ncbi:HET-domain-containing protein, partial [Periconia macrospinosa]